MIRWLSATGYMQLGTVPNCVNILDTRGSSYCKNICVYADGTVKPAKGHNGTCKWKYDGQVFYHV